jgi:hypothetical protein
MRLKRNTVRKSFQPVPPSARGSAGAPCSRRNANALKGRRRRRGNVLLIATPDYGVCSFPNSRLLSWDFRLSIHPLTWKTAMQIFVGGHGGFLPCPPAPASSRLAKFGKLATVCARRCRQCCSALPPLWLFCSQPTTRCPSGRQTAALAAGAAAAAAAVAAPHCG